ncbi:MAG: rRNA maturation RNase YbeY [Clostridiales bacterium]|nr:rRNA maturation RNase YbeY [Clostridiales bacterium]
MIEVIAGISHDVADLEEILTNAAEAALAYEGEEGDITILVVDDETIHEMNRDYRDVDRPTDVLSFPAAEGETLLAIPDAFLGDIAISLPRAQAQAEEYGHSLLRELTFLAVHGSLHLMGYDHMNDADRAEMFARQDRILEKMRITR